MNSFILLLRPQQWVKNVFIFLPMFFGGRIFDLWCWQECIVAFFAFSFMASSIYCLNDMRDIDDDRRHPTKKNRPIASGKITVGQAIVVMIILIALSVAMALCCLQQGALYVAGILLLYLLLNMAYCYKLKHYAIIDVFIISTGFVLRLICGGICCSIWLSPWIVLMTFLLALFLAFAKRRDDVVLYEQKNVLARRNIVRYNVAFLNQTLGIIAAITIVCYIMYTVSPEVTARFRNQYVYISAFFVLAAILRYLQIAIVDLRSGSPTKVLLRDRFIQMCLLSWLLTFVIILYL